MIFCLVKSCNNRGACLEENTSLHRFPEDEELRQKWLQAIGIPTLVINKGHGVCSKHFENKYFRNPMSKSRKRLHSYAIPTLQLSELRILEARECFIDHYSSEEFCQKSQINNFKNLYSMQLSFNEKLKDEIIELDEEDNST